ncbi:MAG TPA: SRPBCC family protein [Roseiflexaceae bacterium]|nr:SRPBCC family protein [Roseiflexaceae bacterium]
MAKQVTRSIIVKGKTSEIYQIWANFENFPHFMKHIKQVTKTGERSSHWVMQGPLGKDISWDAETTRLDENTRIAWNSRDNGDITTSGQVTFVELPQEQTEVTVTMQYVPPAGKLGELVARIFSDPEGQLEEDLDNFKHFAERSRAVGG